MSTVLIHAVLAPLDALGPPDQNDLNRDFIFPDDTWIIEHASGGSEPDRVYLAPPMEGHGHTLKKGEKLIFKRSFAGSPERRIEISQKLVHSLELHFIEERNVYCRLNDNGDLEDVISVTETASENWTENVTVVSILAKDFAEYMCLVGMGMVVFFDFTRVPASFYGWRGQQHFEHNARDVFYHGGVMPGHASYVNGRMIVRPAVTVDEIIQARKDARDPLNRSYAVFKAIELKTHERIEVSCNPSGCLLAVNKALDSRPWATKSKSELRLAFLLSRAMCGSLHTVCHAQGRNRKHAPVFADVFHNGRYAVNTCSSIYF